MSPSANASAVAACTAAGSLPGASSPPVVLLPAAAVLAIADEVLVVVALGNHASTRRDSQKRRDAFRFSGKFPYASKSECLRTTERGDDC